MRHGLLIPGLVLACVASARPVTAQERASWPASWQPPAALAEPATPFAERATPFSVATWQPSAGLGAASFRREEPAQVPRGRLELSDAQRTGARIGALAGVAVGGVVGWSRAFDEECVDEHVACTASAATVGVVSAMVGAVLGGVVGSGLGIVVGSGVDLLRGDAGQLSVSVPVGPR